MKTALYVCVVLIAILISSVPIHCQDDTLVGNAKTISGNIISVDSQSSQIVVRASEAMAFSVPSGAKIVNADGFSIQLSDVKAGNYVTISYTDDKSGIHIMNGMEVSYNR